MNDSQDPALIKRHRFYGVLIVLMIVAPMVIAYIMFQTGWGVSGGTTNKGQLLTPPLAIKSLPLVDGSTYLEDLVNDQSIGKKWRILVPVKADCNETCRRHLYLTRQVHIRLAEKAYRVERIFLALDTLPESLKQELNTEHPNVRWAKSTASHFAQWLVPAVLENSDQYFYLVDQTGFMMMRYDRHHSGQDLLDDVKKLLKFTYDK
ncbi:hypothetical protein AB835_05695 [Candidatus Endobugula sertula]|uniref:Thioredoxin domain-containing protein n=1 Tax=Candidatus Endobugula sertula TaxID=62101 RepID=A0A1D2QQZ2_9GAMM|nr:hypothetical protein AB835_05695 [Candidatus Endobugula sertula]